MQYPQQGIFGLIKTYKLPIIKIAIPSLKMMKNIKENKLFANYVGPVKVLKLNY